ncbi:MAG TPA: sigma 54-interacting transcriptional regulator [Deltaproteobacteria bacterium]|nr:sigma 54-interacting transcriptional regulator [Deltaproteobacteria bacterium]
MSIQSRTDRLRNRNSITSAFFHDDSRALIDQLKLFKLMFDNIYNGIMVTDMDGYVLLFNRPYGDLLGIDPEEQIGRHCTDVVENTRMHIVAKTGKAEINQIQRIKGQDIIVQRIPIYKDGKVIAVFGHVMFKDVKDVEKLAKKLSCLESKVKHYEQELMALRSTRYTFESIIGESGALQALKRDALKATSNNYPVLVTGESGTGKELFAQAIHQGSPRRLYPFIRINCAAIPKDLIESELFGYERGAFTGAKAEGKPGKLELAHRGTLFLDEIGDMPLEMQPKLLRALEEKDFERLGSTKIIRSDFRLIAATNRNLDELIAQSGFRSDLYYRINVIPLHIPPLRERRDDILPLARHLVKKMAQEATFSDIALDQEAEQLLLSYDWPGNVRELVNVLERAMFSMEGDSIHVCDLPFHLRKKMEPFPGPPSSCLKDEQTKAEKKAIINALKETRNKVEAARVLGIHRTLLYKKMKKYKLTPYT